MTYCLFYTLLEVSDKIRGKDVLVISSYDIPIVPVRYFLTLKNRPYGAEEYFNIRWQAHLFYIFFVELNLFR